MPALGSEDAAMRYHDPFPRSSDRPCSSAEEFDPFDSFLRSLAPNEDKLIRVFVQHRVLKAMSYLPDPKMSYISDLDRFWHCVTMYWVQTALWDSGMLDSLFLLTCRYLADRAPGWKSGFTHQALHYKRRCLREIEHSESFTDHVITTRMAIVADETMFGTSTRVERHLRETLWKCVNKLYSRMWWE
ncbi:hypothetical protein CGCF413_v010763 [Colletotrichum fructicola]|nr:hypothetical protein CFRS1_v014205 [Colletotrichum fructicola]KAF5490360.1 hypothetical protein CGCF413_v010763 [Colletotrichum fructicola]